MTDATARLAPVPGASSASAPASPSTAPSATRSAPARTSPKPTTGGGAGFEGQVLTLVNQQRASAGCKPVTSDSRLAAAARAHSQDMAANGYFSHNTQSGVDPGTRITAAGYRWSAWGENIAKGQPDPSSVMNAWMNSPGHRANILNCNFRNLGVGLAYDGSHTPYWTQDFGTPM